LIAEDSASMASSWPKHDPLQFLVQIGSTSSSSLETVFGGMRAILAMVFSISFTPMVFLRLASGSSIWRAGLVDHVDGLVRQLAVVDVARGQFHRRLIASSV
jgi:hypothetical protein